MSPGSRDIHSEHTIVYTNAGFPENQGGREGRKEAALGEEVCSLALCQVFVPCESRC